MIETLVNVGRGQLGGFDSFISGISHKPKSQHIAVSHSNDVVIVGSGESSEEKIKHHRDGGPLRGGISKLRTIDGWAYLCGGNNSVTRREGPDNWSDISKSIPNPDREDYLHNRFEDIDGFNENDIYCVGTDGQVYHFDGKSWRQQDFPSNIHLYTVCCGQDGFVYISGFQGKTFKGKLNTWEVISGPSTTLPFKDMVWYENKVWCTSDHGVWTIENNKVIEAKLPTSGIRLCQGNLSAADGVLLLAGYGGAAFLENGEWTQLYSPGAFENKR